MDEGELLFTVAVTLSFSKKKEQELLEKNIALNCFLINIKKANKLKELSKRGELDEVSLYNILNGEVFSMLDIRISLKIIKKYF